MRGRCLADDEQRYAGLRVGLECVAAGQRAGEAHGGRAADVHEHQRVAAVAFALAAGDLSVDADADVVHRGDDLRAVTADGALAALEASGDRDEGIAAQIVEVERVAAHGGAVSAVNPAGDHHRAAVGERGDKQAGAACLPAAAAQHAVDARIELAALMLDADAGAAGAAGDGAVGIDEQLAGAGEGDAAAAGCALDADAEAQLHVRGAGNGQRVEQLNVGEGDGGIVQTDAAQHGIVLGGDAQRGLDDQRVPVRSGQLAGDEDDVALSGLFAQGEQLVVVRRGTERRGRGRRGHQQNQADAQGRYPE